MIYLLLTCVVIFTILIISNRLFGERALITVGIGSAIGANFYNINNFPFTALAYEVSIEACLFSLFIFCVVLSYVFYSKKSATTLLITVICAIMFTSILEFLAILSNTSVFKVAILRFGTFLINISAIFIAGTVSIYVFSKLKKKVSTLVNIIIFVVLANTIKIIIDIINSTIVGLDVNILSLLIAVILPLIFCIVSYIIITKYEYKQKMQIVHTLK